MAAFAGLARYGSDVMSSINSVVPGQDVPTIWLSQHKLFAETCFSQFFAFALELDARQENLRVQAVMTCRSDATDAGCITLRELLKSVLCVHSLEVCQVTVRTCVAFKKIG